MANKQSITESADLAVQQSSSQPQTEFDAILNSIPDVIIRVDLNGKIVWWNKNFENIISLSKEKLLTCLTSDLFKSCDGEISISSIIDETINNGNAEVDAYLSTNEGSKRYHLKNTLIENAFNKEVLIVGRDINERAQMSDALKKSQTELQKLIDTLPFLVYLTTTDNEFILANKKFCEFIGLSRTDIIGSKNNEFISHNFADCFTRDNEKILSDKCSVHYECVLEINKENISLSIDKFPLLDESQNIYAVCGVVEDVTAQYQLQKQLQQTQKMEAIGQLTGGIAHDFNNVLASIMGYTGLTKKRTIPFNDDTITGYLSQITRAGERARDLVQQLLAFSRGDVGGLQVLDPEALTKESIKMLSSLIPSSINLNLKIRNNNVQHYIEVDPVQFNQSVMNLVINSKDAIADKTGTIDVSLEYLPHVKGVCDSCHLSFSGKFICLSVSDSGMGISDEILSRIFDPFFTTKEVGKGSGMGLSMLHGIVHGSGGHIVVKTNKSLSQTGTSISICFPEIKSKIIKNTNENNTIDKLESKNISKRILLIDDESMITSYLKELFTGEGYVVTTFNDSVKGLNYFIENNQDVDIVVTDQTMPNLTGLELAKNILLSGHNKPVILCTGYSDFGKDASHTDNGVDIIMDKPINDTLLLQNIDNLLNQYKN